MLLYCLMYRKNTESKNTKVTKTKNRRIMRLWKYPMFGSKKIKFINEQEASGLLSRLGIKTPLRRIPLLDPLLFLRC